MNWKLSSLPLVNSTFHFSFNFLLCLKSSANQTMASQTTPTEIEGTKPSNGKQFTSKDVQTDLNGDEVEKLRDCDDKRLEKQLKVDVSLR